MSRKVHALVIYDSKYNDLYSLYVTLSDGTTITLFSAGYVEYVSKVNINESTNFQELYKLVLEIISVNNFDVEFYEEFNAWWYDIQWVDVQSPYRANKYGLPIH